MDDTTDTVGEAIAGLTVWCAIACTHDHDWARVFASIGQNGPAYAQSEREQLGFFG